MGKSGKPKGEPKHRESHCEAGTERKGNGRNRKLSSQEPEEKRTKESRKEGEKVGAQKAKTSTCGTAVGVKQGRAKENKQKAEYKNQERMHGKPGRKEWGNRGSESRNGHRRKPL